METYPDLRRYATSALQVSFRAKEELLSIVYMLVREDVAISDFMRRHMIVRARLDSSVYELLERASRESKQLLGVMKQNEPFIKL